MNQAEQLNISEDNLLEVIHDTIYFYDEPVESSQHYIRLFPLLDRYQNVIKHEILITDNPNIELFEDVFGNLTGLFYTQKPFKELKIRMRAEVLVKPPEICLLGSSHLKQKFPIVWMPWQRQMMLSYLLPLELPESQLSELHEFARSFVERNQQDVIASLNDINQTIYKNFTYQSGTTTANTTPYEVFIHKKGVCQDFANLFMCLARLLNIPARYRVGYIYTGYDYERKIQSEASHAWIEVYLPWLGWIGYDPTNGCIVGTNHVRVSCGRNYYDPPPTSGTIYKGGKKETLEVSVRVHKLNQA